MNISFASNMFFLSFFLFFFFLRSKKIIFCFFFYEGKISDFDWKGERNFLQYTFKADLANKLDIVRACASK